MAMVFSMMIWMTTEEYREGDKIKFRWHRSEGGCSEKGRERIISGTRNFIFIVVTNHVENNGQGGGITMIIRRGG